MSGNRQVRGVCPVDCMDSCAWIATIEDGRVTGVAGDKTHPITRGALCAKLRDYEQRLTAPGRLLHPYKRRGAKGTGAFERISWHEAIDTIAARFTAIIAESGAEALMPFHYLGSMGVVQRQAPMRLFHALGASRVHGNVCAESASALAGQGHPLGVDPEETPAAELVILWGQNTLTTGHHQWHFIEEARRRNGARIIAIDPRATRTTRQADWHLAPRPGSDAVLAAAIGRVMLKERLADLELAALWVADLDAYRAAVAPWTPERAAAATGLDPEDIVALARAFAAATPALIRAGIAPQQTEHGEAYVRQLSALAILGGHWRHRGGGLSILYGPPLDEQPAARTDLLKKAPRSLDMAKLGAILTDASLAPPVHGLMVWSANPASTQIDSGRVKQGLAREDLFTVVADHFVTDTARYADILLPATTQLEHVDVQGAWGHHYVSANTPAIAPLGEARSSGAIMRALAEGLGMTDPALKESDEAIAASVLPEGWSLEDLQARGWRALTPSRPTIAARAKMLHLTGEPIEAPPANPPGHLQLLTPKSHYFLNSSFANMARQRKSQGEPTVQVSAADAERLGLSQGDRVELASDVGRVEVRVRIADGLLAGIAVFEGKWWGAPGEAAAEMNLLTASRWSPEGQPAYNECFVRLRRLGGEEPNHIGAQQATTS
ncbi:MAG: molybdopterin-dependent oxidoreductase [Hyphomicrobiaceae bacterium]